MYCRRRMLITKQEEMQANETMLFTRWVGKAEKVKGWNENTRVCYRLFNWKEVGCETVVSARLERTACVSMIVRGVRVWSVIGEQERVEETNGM